MASTYRFYISALVGTGTRADPKRSRVMQIVQANGGGQVNDMMNAATPFRFSVAFVDSTVHALCVADPNVKALSAELADQAAVDAHMASPVGVIPNGLKNVMEGAGIPLDWVDPVNNTDRDTWAYVATWHFMVQRASGQDQTNVVAFLGNNLDSTVAQVPAAARNAIAAFMDGLGIDRTWIVNTTLVRAIVTFIVNRYVRDPYFFGPVIL
jgi:hypothetical protein